VYVDIDQNPIPFTKEPCLANFDALKALVDGMVSHSPTAAFLLATLRLAEDGCSHGSKWKSISSLETFIFTVQRARQLGRLTPFEAELLTSNARELIQSIRSGDVTCSGQPRSILDWINNWFGFHLENPAEASASNAIHTAPITVQRVYPNPTSGRVNFSQPDQQVVVYDMLGKVIKQTEGVDHIDMTGYQPGVYVIQLSKDNERSRHRVVKR
ncbi:MAG: T9SS type A sorting domain-containing protein, partial [Taibaiella sp.]|nr:T9SS type A sorting domain-containing protein [Taibaiella sp.]